jgi:hypothetical protein
MISVLAIDLQALPEEKSTPFPGIMACCSYTCSTNSCGATCPVA